MKHEQPRFIMRRDGKQWRIWDRDQANWRGKGSLDPSRLFARLNALNDQRKREQHE
jgi:hypothetical protein